MDSMLNKAKETAEQYSGHGTRIRTAKDQYSGHETSPKKDDESFLDKAKDQYSGHGDSHREEGRESFQERPKRPMEWPQPSSRYNSGGSGSHIEVDPPVHIRWHFDDQDADVADADFEDPDIEAVDEENADLEDVDEGVRM
ncbi:hypothetical protein GQ600_14308 [Phytophthora cactorum]|nr:hypothetical protein GQ600_14308 [Phytophthora cactorum]